MRTKLFLSIFLAAAVVLSFMFIQPQLIAVDAQIEVLDTDQGAVLEQPEIIEDSYIVMFDSNRVTSIAKTLREVNQDVKKFDLDVSQVYTHALKGYAIENLTGTNASQILFEIKRTDRDVAAIERDVVTSTSAQFLPWNINRVDAELNTGTSYAIDNREQKPDIDIAVIDSGIDPTHPELNVISAATVFSQYIDQIPRDLCGHGTHVAGTIAARDNLGSIVGMVPGARVWSIQVFDKVGTGCSGSVSGLLAAFDYVTSQAANIEVANFSGSFKAASYPLTTTAINNMVAAGVVFVASAGNENMNVKWQGKSGTAWMHMVPCVIPNTICVGSISDYDGLCGGKVAVQDIPFNFGLALGERDDMDSKFTNWATDGSIDLYAPGMLVLSTTPPPGPNILPYIGGIAPIYNLAFNAGTSMAAPHVAGAAAIALLNNPSWTPAQVETDLKAKAYSRQTTPCSSVVGDSTGMSFYLTYIRQIETQVPPADCVQTTTAVTGNACGIYVDTAKVLDVGGYP